MRTSAVALAALVGIVGFIGASAAPAAAAGPGLYPVICIETELPNGTPLPEICIPDPR